MGTVCQVQEAPGLLEPAAGAAALADPCGTGAALGHQSSRPAGAGEVGTLHATLQLSQTGAPHEQASGRGRHAVEQSVLQRRQMVAGVPRGQAWGQVSPAAEQPALPSCPTRWPQLQAWGQEVPAADDPVLGPCLPPAPCPPPAPCLPSGVHGPAACRCGPTEPPLRRWSQPGACSMQRRVTAQPREQGTSSCACRMMVTSGWPRSGAARRQGTEGESAEAEWQ